MSARLTTLAALLLAGCATAAEPTSEPAADDGRAAWAAQCSDDSAWDAPGPPFHVYGNTWYVGTCGIAALLVTGADGHVLIDGGPATAAPLIAANIRALGFRLADVKLLFASHEHHDHAGGLAELQRLTGARLLSSPAAAPVLATARPDPEDPQAAISDAFPPVEVHGLVQDGRPVTLGPLELTPYFTPGHTAGALSWQWQSCEGDVCRTIVYADSLSPVSADGYRFTDHPAWVAGLRRSIERLATLDCDILLTPHPSASHMKERLTAGTLAGAGQCPAYASNRTALLNARLAREAAGT